ncbi:translation initiation factor 2 [Streptomyces sp. NPDC051907]|uniref:translation initiation factor 2 n=1 Tax=Streptomyces sp. NPDC051907 TaxID=3155284 RepID=UPI00341A2934
MTGVPKPGAETERRSSALKGLAVNPASPLDVLLRLLEPEYSDAWSALAMDRREYPEPLLDAIVRHEHPRLPGGLARNPHVDGELRGRVVDNPHWLVRAKLASGPHRSWEAVARPLPDWVVERMITTYDGQELSELVASRQIPWRLYYAYATHPIASVRRWATNVWEDLPEERRAALLADPHPEVRKSAAASAARYDEEETARQLPTAFGHHLTHLLVNCRLPRAEIESRLAADSEDDGEGHAWAFAHNYSTPPDLVARIAEHPDPKVRLEVARRDELDPAVLWRLARDADPGVRTAVSVRPELTEEERATIDYAVATDEDFEPAEHHRRLPRDPAVLAGYAASAHPLLRRRAAADPDLPDELAAVLVEDDDLGVRVLLAQNHPAAPPALLLRCYLEYTRTYRQRLAELPGFPVEGLAERFADAEDPLLRWLATLDPGLSPDLADRLTRDQDSAIRAAAARHPRLPADRLRALLDDDELASSAAANPALPIEAMRSLLETAAPSAVPESNEVEHGRP